MTEPRLCALLPPPSQAVRLPQTARHSAFCTRGTTSSLIRHSISPEFSLSNTCGGESARQTRARVGLLGFSQPHLSRGGSTLWTFPQTVLHQSLQARPGSAAVVLHRICVHERPHVSSLTRSGTRRELLGILPHLAVFAALQSRQTRWETSCRRRSAPPPSAGRRAAARRRRRQPAGCTPRCLGRLLAL